MAAKVPTPRAWRRRLAIKVPYAVPACLAASTSYGRHPARKRPPCLACSPQSGARTLTVLRVCACGVSSCMRKSTAAFMPLVVEPERPWLARPAAWVHGAAPAGRNVPTLAAAWLR